MSAFRFILVFCAIVLVLAPQGLIAEEKAEKPEEGPTLGKIVWDITLRTTPQDLLVYLDEIRGTYDDLVREKIKPDMIFLFRGLSVQWISETRKRQGMWSQAVIDKVVAQLLGFQKLRGVKMVADLPARELISDSAKDLLPGIKPVKNGFIALMRYHAEGYATISVN